MSNKTGNNTIFSKKTFLLILMIILILVPLLLADFKYYYNNDLNQNFPQENDLNINKITKDNYTEILTTAKHGLGNITVNNINFEYLELGIFNENVYHPLIIEDIINQTLKINVIKMQFIETTSSAIIENLDNQINKNTVTIKLNESLHVEYNNTEARYLIYHSRYVRANLKEFYVNNGSTIIKLTDGKDFTTDEAQFLIFYYEDYFKKGRIFNFDMYLIWEFDLGIGDWKLEQEEHEFFEITEVEQEITSKFQYKFYLIGWRHGLYIEETIPIDSWSVALTINPFDKEEFNNHKIILNGIEVSLGEHLNPDKSIRVRLFDQFTPDYATFSLNFTTTYLLRFEEFVGKSWAIDRLVAERYIRERIYILSLKSGPRHIYLKNVIFTEPAINFGEVIDVYALFNREVSFYDINTSRYNKVGLNVTIPYLYVGESCPLSIKYLAYQKLKIVITDDIKMPLVGAKIEIFLLGAPYGTYISNSSSQPIIPRRSDENGKIIIKNVPRGNYTIKIYWQGRFAKEATISTSEETNYVYTSIPNSALWVIVFGVINGFILIIGAIFYLKNKKLR